MQKVRGLTASIVAATLILGGCGDGGGSSGDPLTQDEAVAIFGELFTIAFGALGAPPAVAAAPAVAITPITTDCELAGSITLSGDVTENETSVSFNLTETINNCKFEYNPGPGGIVFTVNGDPNINWSGTLSVNGETLSGTFTMKGGFTYDADDGRSGGCGIDVSVNFSTLQASGKICGQSVSG